MDNRIERIVAILFCCLTLAFCITACGRAEPTSDTANPTPTPEAQDTSIFQNIVNLETRLPGVLYGRHWIETFEEYKGLGLPNNYDESFFEDKVLILIKMEWNEGGPDRTLLPDPVIKDGVLYPVINIHSNKDELCTPASMTTIMIAEADKVYATMPLGKNIFTYSGTAYEPDSETYDDDINNE